MIIQHIAFRTDATRQIGIGHFMRCLTLAEDLKKRGVQIRFISRDLPEHLQTMLIAKDMEFVPLNTDTKDFMRDELAHAHWLACSQAQDAQETLQALADKKWDWLIVDHYALDARWESTIRQSVKKIFVLDDLADRQHDCDALLDQNLYQDMQTRYTNKVSAHCQLWLGSRYAILRDEFVQLREQAKLRTGQVKHILVFFGGSDIDNHTVSAIEALVNIDAHDLHVEVVVGEQHSFCDHIKSVCEDYGFVCHIQTNTMAELMAAADLAIGAGGISTYERLYLRLPSVLKPIALNQVDALSYMSQMGCFELFSTTIELQEILKKLINNGTSVPPDCVENGKTKIIEFMLTDFVRLALPKALDVRRTFWWLQNKKLLDDFMISERPSRMEHTKYWRRLLNDPKQRVYSIMYFGKHVGNCGLKNIDDEKATSELWIYIGDSSMKRLGIAQCAVSKLLSVARCELAEYSVYLHVAKINFSAIRLYKKTGFFESHILLSGRWLGQDSKMLRMECIL